MEIAIIKKKKRAKENLKVVSKKKNRKKSSKKEPLLKLKNSQVKSKINDENSLLIASLLNEIKRDLRVLKAS